VRVSKLFLWGQSENISISVKDDKIFRRGFPLSVMCLRPLLSPQNLIGLTIIKVCFGKAFRCHLLIIRLSKHMQETRKHEKAKLQSHLNWANGNVVEDLSCVTKI
jgi:hypothetical protein